MNNWTEQLLPIIIEFKDGNDEPLDSNCVDKLCHIIKTKINLQEGNITEAEYEKELDRDISEVEYAYIMVGNEDAIKEFQDLDRTNEADVEEYFEENSSSYEVGKYRKDILDSSLLGAIQNWGSYIYIDLSEYEFLR
jgi:hypothetical protein